MTFTTLLGCRDLLSSTWNINSAERGPEKHFRRRGKLFCFADLATLSVSFPCLVWEKAHEYLQSLSWSMWLTTGTEPWIVPMIYLLLLLGCIDLRGTTAIPVTGEKGGNITLACEIEDHDISVISLNSRSEIIPVCQTEECSGRVYKEGDCDVFIKNLSFSDAGKYFSHVFYLNDQTELQRQIRTYQLCVHDEVSVKIGEELKLDVLLSDADKVQHQSRRSTEWKEVWSRTDGVQRERITIRDTNLIISNFTAGDAGTYEVLDPDGEPLITVTVTETKEKLDDTDEDRTDDTEYHSRWSLAAPLTVLLLPLIVTAVLLLKCWHRGYLKGAASKGKGGLNTGDPEALKDLEDVC